MLATMVGRQRKFQVSNGLKRLKERQKLKFLAKHFLQCFQVFSILMKICRRNLSIFQDLHTLLQEKRKKYSYSSQLKKKNSENLDFVLYNRLFFLQLVILSSIGLLVQKIAFYFTSWFTVQFLFFDVRMTQELSKGGIGNAKQLGIANFKNNFNLLVMNITQMNFLYGQNVHI